MRGCRMVAAAVLAAILVQGCSDGKHNKHNNTTAPSSIPATDSSEKNTSLPDQNTSSGQVSSDKPAVDTSADDFNSSESDGNAAASDPSPSQSSSVPAAASPALKSLSLIIPVTELQESNETTPTVEATYTDGTRRKISVGITWQISDPNVIEAEWQKLIAKGEGTATIRAEVAGTRSPERSITVYKVINGHRLPPEPDPAINNSTLLGIDSNDNGVRDDVERYIYNRYSKDPDFPKTKIALAMQYAWATQKVLEKPVIESDIYLEDALSCESYWLDKQTENMSGFDYIKYSMKHAVFNDTALKDVMLNTKQRIQRKFQFNAACSGHIFPSRKKSLQPCQTNIDLLEE